MPYHYTYMCVKPQFKWNQENDMTVHKSKLINEVLQSSHIWRVEHCDNHRPSACLIKSDVYIVQTS